MDWLRRNWPDLLIGVALVAVLAGIIATLISGGSFFPVGKNTRAGTGSTGTTQSSTVTPTTPATPGTTGAATGATGTPAASQTGTESGAVGQPDPTVDAGAQGQESTTGAQTDSPIAVLPPSGTAEPAASGTSGASPAGTSAGVTGGTPATGATSTAGASTGGTSAAAGAAATPAGTTSAQGAAAGATPTPAPASSGATAGADESSYRVSVGAFGNADNAQRLAATFQAAGYPVLLGSQGNLTIVLIGPYETEEQARSVAGAVARGGFDVPDPTVYRYDPAGGGAGAAGPATPAPAASTPATAGPATPSTGAATGATAPASGAATATTTTTTTTTPAATSSAGRYLQVGAYGSRESAVPQIGQLEKLGFTVSERTEGNLLKLLVGPFEGTALTEAQARLTAAGIESFAR